MSNDTSQAEKAEEIPTELADDAKMASKMAIKSSSNREDLNYLAKQACIMISLYW